MRGWSLAATVISAIAVAPACAPSAEAARDPRLIAGFDPPAPAPGEIRVVAPAIRAIPPGADVTYCTYIENPFPAPVDVVQSLGHQSDSGHHAVLMEVVGATEPVGASHECTEKDMQTARFLAGGSDAAQDSAFRIPDGVGFRITPAARLMVQTHWINATRAPIDGQAVFNVATRPPDDARHQAQLFTALTTRVKIPPRGSGVAETSCTIKSRLQIFNFGGHAHEWGSRVRIERSRGEGRKVLYDREWLPEYSSRPPFETFEVNAPLVLEKGDVLHLRCEYKNPEEHEIRFPREMCVAFGFYFPARGDIQCADGAWSER